MPHNPLASAISCRWPSSPKPVTSVAACTPTSTIASQARRFSVAIDSMTSRARVLGLETALDRGGHDAGADRLGEEQHVARASAPTLRTTLVGMHDAHHREPELGLLVVDRCGRRR